MPSEGPHLWRSREAINVGYNEGETINVPEHDGSVIRLRKTHPDYDPTDRVKALEYVAHRAAKGGVVTGLLYLYLDPNPEDLHAHLNTVETPFNKLGEKDNILYLLGNLRFNLSFITISTINPKWNSSFRKSVAPRAMC